MQAQPALRLKDSTGKAAMKTDDSTMNARSAAQTRALGPESVRNLTKALEIYRQLLSHIDQRPPSQRASTISAISDGLHRLQDKGAANDQHL